MIVLARQEGTPGENAREKLRRRSSVRRKSTGDLAVQVHLGPGRPPVCVTCVGAVEGRA